MNKPTEEEILNNLQSIFRTVFDDDTLIVNSQTNSEDIEDWDSLEQINLLVAIEKFFNIKFDISEISNLLFVGDMVNLIKRKVG